MKKKILITFLDIEAAEKELKDVTRAILSIDNEAIGNDSFLSISGVLHSRMIYLTNILLTKKKFNYENRC